MTHVHQNLSGEEGGGGGGTQSEKVRGKTPGENQQEISHECNCCYVPTGIKSVVVTLKVLVVPVIHNDKGKSVGGYCINFIEL